jgi:pimeloyl-ACP methyl ester carboxylesterase
MPYATSTDGVRIHYAVEGRGQPLVLAHWLAGSGEDWRDFGYVGMLRDEYRLILVDARGHGASDKPHDPTVNTADHVARDHVAVLDALSIECAHFWGYSSGGTVAFAAALLAPARFQSLVIGGTDPWWTPEWVTGADEMIALLDQGMAATLATWEAWLGPWPEPLRQRTLANDPEALAARFASAYADPGYRARLGEIAHPSLLYRAEGDPQSAHAADTAALMPNARYVALPGLNHLTAFIRSDRVVPTVRRFLAAGQ